MAALLLTAAPRAATAKSLYVIANILRIPGATPLEGGTPIHAYDIGPDGKLTFQALGIVPYYGIGPVGLALDSKSEHLFITYEKSNVIGIVDATTLKSADWALASGATNLAGIVYDHSKELVYCMDRNQATLYAFRWDPADRMLNQVSGSPFTLAGSMAFGIALDETKGELYVGGPTPAVHVYSTSDWKLIRKIPLGHVAISVAVDPARRFLYVGGGYPVTASYLLTQFDLITAQERQVTVDPNAGVMGLGVDAETGYIYMSTGRNNLSGGDDLLVFDSDLGRIDIVEDIGNPTGLVVPGGPISYNPLRLTKTVAMPVGAKAPAGADRPAATIGEEVTYSICFDHNDLPLTEVSIIDILPTEMTFVRATGDGEYGRYDSQAHAYTWLNPPLSGGRTACLELVGRLAPGTPEGRIVTNRATIDTKETPPTTTAVEVVAVTRRVYKPLRVSKTVVAGATGGGPSTPASVEAGAELTYRITFDNRDNSFRVENVRLTDTLPPQVDFVRASDDGLLGRYEPSTHTYTWSCPGLESGESNSIDIVVRLDVNVAGGALITNTATVEGDSTPVGRAGVDLKVADYLPLGLEKTLVGGAVGQPDSRGRPRVEPGTTITYALRFRNPATNGMATQISLVDSLPRDVTFVSAAGDREIGFYDPNTHTYTWRYPSLEPGGQQSLNLAVRVNERTEPNAVIRNAATITSKQTPATTATLDVVTAAKVYRPVHLIKTVIAGATGGDATTPASARAGDELTYRIICDNKDNDSPLANVRFIDELPRQVTFVRATGDGLFGRYESSTHTYTWSYPQLAAGESYLVDLVVRLAPDLAEGTIVTNTVTVTGTDAPTARAAVDIRLAQYAPLALQKTLLHGAVGQPDDRGRSFVEAGGTLTYSLSFSNPPTNRAVSQIVLADTLPREVSFVSADGDRNFGSYDPTTHTYTWRYASLAPGAQTSLSLTVRVNDDVEPNTMIANTAAITAREAATTRVRTEVVVRAVPTPPATDVRGLMYIKPDHIYRNNSRTKVELMVVLHLPEGIGKEMIRDAPIVLTPGNVPAEGQQIFGTSAQGKVLCFFDVNPILAATQGYGEFLLTATGRLTDGRTFVCQTTIWIAKFGGP